MGVRAGEICGMLRVRESRQVVNCRTTGKAPEPQAWPLWIGSWFWVGGPGAES